jgi:hypothetical protein
LDKPLDTDALLCALNHSDVRSMAAGPVRQSFLRKAKCLALFPNALSKFAQ